MPTIHLSTTIAAPPERVFDLARSIDAHVASTEGTRERAVAGVTSGLIGLNEEVTWEARHLGKMRKMTSRITAFDRPRHFQDVMVSGDFKMMRHDHEFSSAPAGTLMVDHFQFESPYGPLGLLANLFLTGYMRRLLTRRNLILKRLAESDDWHKILGAPL